MDSDSVFSEKKKKKKKKKKKETAEKKQSQAGRITWAHHFCTT